MEVVETKELEDGGAEYTFEMTDEEQEIMFDNGLKSLTYKEVEDYCVSQYKTARDAVIQLGIMDAIVKGIKHAETGQAAPSEE